MPAWHHVTAPELLLHCRRGLPSNYGRASAAPILRTLRREGERKEALQLTSAHLRDRTERKEGSEPMQRRWLAGEEEDVEDVEEEAVGWLRERDLLGHRVLLVLLTGRGVDSCCRYELIELLSWRGLRGPALTARGTRGGEHGVLGLRGGEPVA